MTYPIPPPSLKGIRRSSLSGGPSAGAGQRAALDGPLHYHELLTEHVERVRVARASLAA